LTALRGVLLKNRRLVRKKNILFPSTNSTFQKADCGVPSRLAKATLKGLGLDGLTEQSAKL